MGKHATAYLCKRTCDIDSYQGTKAPFSFKEAVLSLSIWLFAPKINMNYNFFNIKIIPSTIALYNISNIISFTSTFKKN